MNQTYQLKAYTIWSLKKTKDLWALLRITVVFCFVFFTKDVITIDVITNNRDIRPKNAWLYYFN